jgi:peroxiredoxin
MDGVHGSAIRIYGGFMSDHLENGDDFPTITAPAVEGEPLTLPDDLDDLWSVLIFYRGHW